MDKELSEFGEFVLIGFGFLFALLITIVISNAVTHIELNMTRCHVEDRGMTWVTDKSFCSE